MTVTIRRLTPDDWQDWRDLRLFALEESPSAFGASLAFWQDATEDRWRSRLVDVALNLLAVDDATGAPLGQASGIAADGDGRAELISMYVHPVARGTGVGVALIDAVAAWAAGDGATELVLSVKRDNHIARRLYLRVGFVDRGEAGDEPDEQRLRRPLPP